MPDKLPSLEAQEEKVDTCSKPELTYEEEQEYYDSLDKDSEGNYIEEEEEEDFSCLDAMSNPNWSFVSDSSTFALWLVMSIIIGVASASFTEMQYDVFISVIRETKYPEL